MNIIKIDNLKLNTNYSSFDKLIILSENNIINSALEINELNKILANEKIIPTLGNYIFIQAENNLEIILNDIAEDNITTDIIQYLYYPGELVLSRAPLSYSTIPVTSNVSKSFYITKQDKIGRSLILNDGTITKLNVKGNKSLLTLVSNNELLLDSLDITELENPNNFKFTNTNTLIKYFIFRNKNIIYILKDFSTGVIIWPNFYNVEQYINTQEVWPTLTNYYFLNYLSPNFTQAELSLAQDKNINLISLK